MERKEKKDGKRKGGGGKRDQDSERSLGEELKDEVIWQKRPYVQQSTKKTDDYLAEGRE